MWWFIFFLRLFLKLVRCSFLNFLSCFRVAEVLLVIFWLCGMVSVLEC